MPRIYKSTMLPMGGFRVNVQQVLGQGDAAVVDFLKICITDARDRLARILGAKDRLAASKALKYYFQGNPSVPKSGDVFDADDTSDKVAALLVKIQQGLSADHGIKVVEMEDTVYGYVSTYENQGGRQGDIHISRSCILGKKTDLVVMTYIHEASHKFAQTKDHAARGYLHGLVYPVPGLTAAEALINADSYAGFVMRLSDSIRKQESDLAALTATP